MKNIKIPMLILIMVLSMVTAGVVMAEPVSAAKNIVIPVNSTSAQIQAIIDNSTTEDEDTISFRTGTYTDIKLTTNKTLNFVGNGAQIYGVNETDTSIFTVKADGDADGSYSTFNGFEFFLLNNNVTLSSGKKGSTGYAINLASVANVVVRNVTSHNGKAAVYNGGSTNTLIENCTFDDQYLKCYAVHIMGGDNITIRNNTIIGAMDGVSMAQSATNIYVDSNLFLNNDFAAFWGGGISNITFINNVFDGFNEGLGIEKAANQTYIINNTFINGNGDAIYIMNSGAHGSMSVISSIEIINNLFKDIVGAAIGIDKAGNFNADGSGHSIVGINNSVQNVSKGYVVLYSNGDGQTRIDNLNFTLDSSYPQPEPVKPVITSIDPKDKAVNVSPSKTIKVTFNEDIKKGTLWIELINSSKKAVSFTSSISGKVLTIKPQSKLAESQYKLILHTGAVTNLAGNPVALYSSSFTVDSMAPKVSKIDPANGATKVAAGKTIKVTFNEAIKAGSKFWVDLKNSSGKAVPFNYSISGKVLTIDPKSNLPESLYTLVIHTGAVTDLAGNPVALKSSKFSVGTAPTVSKVDPKSGATKVARSKTIKVTFNENIKAGSNYWIELKTSNGKSVKINSKSISGKVLTIQHAKLAANTKYNLTIHTGAVTDKAGNPFAVKTYNFTTGKS